MDEPSDIACSDHHSSPGSRHGTSDSAYQSDRVRYDSTYQRQRRGSISSGDSSNDRFETKKYEM